MGLQRIAKIASPGVMLLMRGQLLVWNAQLGDIKMRQARCPSQHVNYVRSGPMRNSWGRLLVTPVRWENLVVHSGLRTAHLVILASMRELLVRLSALCARWAPTQTTSGQWDATGVQGGDLPPGRDQLPRISGFPRFQISFWASSACASSCPCLWSIWEGAGSREWPSYDTQELPPISQMTQSGCLDTCSTTYTRHRQLV